MSTPVADLSSQAAEASVAPATSAAPDLNAWLLTQLQPIAQDAIAQVEAAVAAKLAAHKAEVEAQLAKAGDALAKKTVADPWTPRIVIAGVMTVLLGVTIAAMLGNHWAQSQAEFVKAGFLALLALMARLEGVPWPAQKG